VLDLDPVVAAERRTARGSDDRFERMDLAFHQRVTDAYRTEAARAGLPVVDADGTPDEVTNRLWAVVAPLLDPPAPSVDPSGDGATPPAP
jgi:dTMP kinase